MTEQDADDVVPDRVQLAVGVNVLVPTVLVKLTVPVGVFGLAKVSVTVAVHVVPWRIETVEGEQTIAVVVV